MSEIARAYIQLVPSAKGFKSSITSEINPSQLGSDMGDQVSGGFGSKFKSALAKLGIGLAVGKVFKDAFAEGSQLEQSLGGIETLFGKSANKMIAQANNAWKSAGMSANSYMQLATSFSASLLQSLNGDTEEAARVTDMAITDMSDNANKMGSNMEDIKNAYQGFAKHNYTMLDNLKLGELHHCPV